MRCPTLFTMAVALAAVESLFCFRNVSCSEKLMASICELGTRSSCRRPVTGTVEQLTATYRKLSRKIFLSIGVLLFKPEIIAFLRCVTLTEPLYVFFYIKCLPAIKIQVKSLNNPGNKTPEGRNFEEACFPCELSFTFEPRSRTL